MKKQSFRNIKQKLRRKIDVVFCLDLNKNSIILRYTFSNCCSFKFVCCCLIDNNIFYFQMSPVNETKIVLGEGYAWILFEVVLISIHIWITGMAMGSVRRRYFTKDFYEKHFPQYKSLTSVMNTEGGYPDDGQGRLSDKLNDEQWFTFNNYRRAHYNYLEVFLTFAFSFQIFSF
jgi:hypothetical protein